MLDFDYTISTKILFGKGKIKLIAEEIKKYSDRVLFIYGGGSIKKIGLYAEVVKLLEDNGIYFKELPGVQPNPRLSKVKEGIKLCKENNLGFILAVGGGSTIDCAKAIAFGFFYKGDLWDEYLGRVRGVVEKALPIGSVLTLAATGSEMNGGSVITKEETNEKLATGADCMRPKFSVLDPTYTFSVPKDQTAAGTVDTMSHVFEQYFAPHEAFLPEKLAEAVLKTCIKFGPIAIEKPKDYETRANLMWASSLGLNGLLSYGKGGDWATHLIEHEVSAVNDMTHGTGLAIITPAWMEQVLDKDNMDRFIALANNVWCIEGDDMETAKKAVNYTKDFFESLGIPLKLSKFGIKEEQLPYIAKQAVRFGEIGQFKKLGEKDVLEILRRAY